MKYLKFLAATGILVVANAFVCASANEATTAEKALQRDAVCTKCHDESETRPVLSIYQTRHGVKADERTPTCQQCHGESEKHVKGDAAQKGRVKPDIVFGKGSGTYQPDEAPTQAAACLGCHKNGARSHWSGSQHESHDIACAQCHRIHVRNDPVLTKTTQAEVCFVCHKEQRAQTHRYSTHPLDAGKMSCSDCHNPHGTTGPTLLVKNSVNDTCYTCHAEKRGPFLWEHGPVADDCTNCHTPHGSNNQPLLKTRAPYLCQECHVADHGRTLYSGQNLPGGASPTALGTQTNPLLQSPNAQANGRSCLQCHSQIHGSNHPGGAKFLR